MALLSRPLASCGVDGTTSLRPGVWSSHASTLLEWWAAAELMAPSGIRSTIGTLHCPPNM